MVRRAATLPMPTFSFFALAVLLGCGQGDGASKPQPSAQPSSVKSTMGAPPPASAKPAPASTAHPWAGVWSGRFEAKKGSVSVPEGVAYPVWEKEKGDSSSGAGTLKLTVTPDGEVSGEGKGALGAFFVRGRIEGKVLRGGVTPADPEADASMQGVLTATEKRSGKTLEAKLQVAGGQGARVRTATFVLAQGAPGGDGTAEPATPAPSSSAPPDSPR